MGVITAFLISGAPINLIDLPVIRALWTPCTVNSQATKHPFRPFQICAMDFLVSKRWKKALASATSGGKGFFIPKKITSLTLATSCVLTYVETISTDLGAFIMHMVLLLIAVLYIHILVSFLLLSSCAKKYHRYIYIYIFLHVVSMQMCIHIYCIYSSWHTFSITTYWSQPLEHFAR